MRYKFSFVPLAVAQCALLLPGFLQAQTAGVIARPDARTPIQVTNRAAQLYRPL